MPTNAPNIPFIIIKASIFPSVSYRVWITANKQPENEAVMVLTTDLAAKHYNEIHKYDKQEHQDDLEIEVHFANVDGPNQAKRR